MLQKYVSPRKKYDLELLGLRPKLIILDLYRLWRSFLGALLVSSPSQSSKNPFEWAGIFGGTSNSVLGTPRSHLLVNPSDEAYENLFARFEAS